MRLTVCALSAVLLSGCSWMGYGNSSSSSSSSSSGYGVSGGCGQQMTGYNVAPVAYGGGCGGAGGYGVANGYGMGANGYGAGAGVATGYGMGAGGYGAGGAAGYGMGANGYGAGTGGATGYGMGAGGYGAGGANGYGVGATGYGLRGAQGYGGGYGAGTVLGGAAPYGAAVGGGAGYASSGQYVNGQWVGGSSSSYQTVQGAPIYVPQPYPAYYGVGYNAGAGYSYGMRGASAALPFGLEFGVGTNIGIGGNIVDAKPAGVATGGVLNVSATPAISYKDAYKNAVNYDMAATYDIGPSTTVLGRLGYSRADGNKIKTGTIDDGVLTEDLYAQWGDLEQVTIEGGVRQYLGGWNNRISGIRPFVGATAGFTHNNDVSLEQSSATLMPTGANVQPYLDAGWTPTASATVGAEMQVGARTAIGVETGVRWNDDVNSNVLAQEDRWSVPMKIRGRISF